MTARPIMRSAAVGALLAVVAACAPSQDPRWERGDAQRVRQLADALGDDGRDAVVPDNGTAVDSGGRIVLVDRGSVSERITIDGVVAIADPVVVVAPSDGRVDRRLVAVGAPVSTSEELVVLEPPPQPADPSDDGTPSGEPPGTVADTSAATVITSPVDATVGRYVVRTSEVVAAGDPLVELGDPTQRVVLVELSADVASVLASGAVAEVTDLAAATPQAISTDVVRIRDEVDGVATVELSFDRGIADQAAGRLEIGDRVAVSIGVGELVDVLRVPNAAVRTDARGVFVVVDRGDRWERVDVLTGPIDGDVVALLPPTDLRRDDRLVVP